MIAPSLRIGLLSCLIGAIAGCSDGGDDLSPAATLSVDCTAGNSGCPALTIAGDAPSDAPSGGATVRGYGDPSLRRDPAGALWLGYSWIHPVTSTGLFGQTVFEGVGVNTHLARSDDGGRTWTFIAEPWVADEDARDPTGDEGHINSETVALAPRPTAGGTRWYASRMLYFTPDGGSPQVQSFTTHVTAADAPELFGAADEAVLGGALTDAYWNPDVNLAALSPELAGCTFYDAGLLFHDGRLLLAVQCGLFTQDGEDTEHEFVAVFATAADGPPQDWNWAYLGQLADAGDAAELGGLNLLQTDLAVGADGRLLAIFSPSAPRSAGGTLAQHFGCRVVEIASLDPPALARDGNGALRVRASVTASDLAAPDGSPASCAYDAASATGVVIARRNQSEGLESTIHASGLRP